MASKGRRNCSCGIKRAIKSSTIRVEYGIIKQNLYSRSNRFSAQQNRLQLSQCIRLSSTEISSEVPDIDSPAHQILLQLSQWTGSTSKSPKVTYKCDCPAHQILLQFSQWTSTTKSSTVVPVNWQHNKIFFSCPSELAAQQNLLQLSQWTSSTTKSSTVVPVN
jgi:hypothetical protein